MKAPQSRWPNPLGRYGTAIGDKRRSCLGEVILRETHMQSMCCISHTPVGRVR